VCSVQYAAHGGDGSTLGRARVSGGCRAAVGGGGAKAVTVLFILGCGLPEPVVGIAMREVQRATARAY